MFVIDAIADSRNPECVTPSPTHHDVWLLAYEGIQPLDLVGPHEVFDAANRVADHRNHGTLRYRLHVVASRPGPVVGESGLAIHASSLPNPDAVDGTLLIPGGNGSAAGTAIDANMLRWVRDAGLAAGRVASVCTGTFIVADAGLLQGKRAATHWAYAGQLAAAHPEIEVDHDAIWVRDGTFWSSAGVTAGIDLALALVEDDLGADIAQEVSRWLVVFLRRPGGQSQFAATVWSERAEAAPIRQAQDIIHADPAAELSIETLAERVGLSSRHLTRRFRTEVGETPARYIEKVRLEAARQQLQSTGAGMQAIAKHCGFGTAETLRRTFQRRMGVSPDDYRKRFALDRSHPPTASHVHLNS